MSETGRLCGLTFELSGRRRQDARPGLVRMYRVPPDRAWWPAVGAPLERGVRRLHAMSQPMETPSGTERMFTDLPGLSDSPVFRRMVLAAAT